MNSQGDVVINLVRTCLHMFSRVRLRRHPESSTDIRGGHTCVVWILHVYFPIVMLASKLICIAYIKDFFFEMFVDR